MTIGRRQVFSLGALGLGALALEGCGAGPMPSRGATLGPADVEHLLDQLDKVVLHVEAYGSGGEAFGIRRDETEVARGRQRCIGLLTTLCFLGTYRDLPTSAWQEPRVAAHLARSLPRIQAVLSEAHEHLASMSNELVAAIDARLARDPELPMEIMARIDGYGKEIDVPVEQRTYLRLSTAQLAARFRYEGVREVTGKLASTYDRMLGEKIAELGLDLDRPLRRSHERPVVERGGANSRPELLGSVVANRSRGVEGESCVTDADCDTGLTCQADECDSEGGPSHPLRKTGMEVAVVGAWLLIPPLCPIGVLVLLESLFIAIMSGIVGSKDT